jgi:hypothetical protein
LNTTIDRYGTLRIGDAVFYAPVSSPGAKPLPTILDVGANRPTSRPTAECKSGPCKHAHKPKCRCGCKGSGHRAAILAVNHSMAEYTGQTEPIELDPHNNYPSIPTKRMACEICGSVAAVHYYERVSQWLCWICAQGVAAIVRAQQEGANNSEAPPSPILMRLYQ